MKSDKKWRISMKDTTIASNFNIKYYNFILKALLIL